MNEKELKQKLESIRDDMKLVDLLIQQDYSTSEGKLTEKQAQIIRNLFEIFNYLNWQLSFNEYKELRLGDTKPINTLRCGTPVKVRSCKEGHGDKTYFGILLGDVALSISHSIKDNVVTASHSYYNPAIFIPELNDIVYGMESWWGRIKNKDDLDKLITDDVIKNVWYVKMLENNKS